MRRRLLGLLAGPILIAQCAPPQCAPAPAPPPPVETVPATTAPPPPEITTTTTVAPPTSWAFLASEGELYTHWSGCKNPIRYQLDVTITPSVEMLAAIDAALDTAEEATGHTFEFAGEAGPTLQPGVEAVIGLRDLPGGTFGQGGGRFTSSYEMVSGLAYVDDELATDPNQAALLRTTLLHEVGHLLGLGHVPLDRDQVMHPVLISPPKQDYQWGDLEGLRRVGATMPCFEALARAGEPTREVLLD